MAHFLKDPSSSNSGDFLTFSEIFATLFSTSAVLIKLIGGALTFFSKLDKLLDELIWEPALASSMLSDICTWVILKPISFLIFTEDFLGVTVGTFLTLGLIFGWVIAKSSLKRCWVGLWILDLSWTGALLVSRGSFCGFMVCKFKKV